VVTAAERQTECRRSRLDCCAVIGHEGRHGQAGGCSALVRRSGLGAEQAATDRVAKRRPVVTKYPTITAELEEVQQASGEERQERQRAER